MNVKAGDKVLLPEYGGSKVKLGDEELLIYKDTDIIAKLEAWSSSTYLSDLGKEDDNLYSWLEGIGSLNLFSLFEFKNDKRPKGWH